MNAQAKKTGFTLIELMVVMGIFTLIIGAGFTLLSSGRLSTDISEAQIQTVGHARLAMDRISKELRLSHFSRLRISNSVNFTAAEISPGSIINFQIPVGSYDVALDLDGTSLKWGSAANEGDYLAYQVDANNQLLRTAYVDVNGANPSDVVIAQNIASITFSRTGVNSNLITITIVTQRQTVSGIAITQTLHSNVTLRN